MRIVKAATAIALLLTAGSASAQQPSAPNIIYILADDLGYGDVSGFNPESRIVTPHLDALIENGLKFTDAHTSSSVCTPTRYGILTGRYNWRSPLKKSVLSGFSKALIPRDRLTVAAMLQRNGYHTGFVGKWHLGWDWQLKPEKANLDELSVHPDVDYTKPVRNGPNDLGFDYSYGICGSLDMPPYVYVENGQSTSIPTDTTQSVDDKGFWRKGLTGKDFSHADVIDRFQEKALRYIAERADQKEPFFLYYALAAPHTPILPGAGFIGKSNTNFYGDFVLQVDDQIGQIYRLLVEKGIEKNTMIVFTSDNGCSPKANFAELEKVGHRPSYVYRGHKADIFEGGHRVPFFVYWPEKVPEKRQSDRTICTTDFFATAADIVGYKTPDNAGEDSFSFLDVIRGNDRADTPQRGVVHHSIDGRFAIRQGHWKLIMCPGSGGWSAPRTIDELAGLPEFQLYDLQRDPGEQHNVIGQYPDQASSMKTRLTRYINEGRSTPGKPQKNDPAKNWPGLEWMK